MKRDGDLVANINSKSLNSRTERELSSAKDGQFPKTARSGGSGAKSSSAGGLGVRRSIICPGRSHAFFLTLHPSSSFFLRATCSWASSTIVSQTSLQSRSTSGSSSL